MTPTPSFRQGDVVKVPFPYTDRDTRQHRPALVVSRNALGDDGSLLWVVMVTSAANGPWAGDIPLVENHEEVGLPVPSIIRPTKIATIEVGQATRLGTLSAALWSEVAAALRSNLGYSGDDPSVT
jgi:mRNA interferase MazF